MKNTLLLLAILLSASMCFAQSFIYEGSTNFEFSPIELKPLRLDTVKAVLLVTVCDDCQSQSISAYVIREWIKTLYEESMIYTLKDVYEITGYLDKNKKPFPKATTIWQSRVK